MRFGAVILAGGLSSRMGREKAMLRLNGVRFLDRLAFELCGFSELLVSVDEKSRHPDIAYPMVEDIFPRCGAIGGLYAALLQCGSQALVTVPCDLPLFSKKIAEEMCGQLDGETDAVIAVTQDGRAHPLCGVYRKECHASLEQCIQEGEYRLQRALTKLRVRRYSVGADSWRLSNINTQEEFCKLQEPRNCLAISGWKNAGKTTLIEKLIPELTQSGLRVAVIKHDGHSYVPDVPGTDSYRFFQAGACASVVYDREKYSMTRRGQIREEELLALAPEADLILLEGAKGTGYPKLEILREEGGKGVMADLTGRLAFVSDMRQLPRGIPVFDPDDIVGIAGFILEEWKHGRLKERWRHGANQ